MLECRVSNCPSTLLSEFTVFIQRSKEVPQ